MAWVVPETRMIIFKGVPLDPDYQHTIWFETEAMQREYFRMDNGVFSYSKGTCRAFSSLTYQRNTRNIRLPVNQQEILEFNYFMYLNQAYGDKRFYGFILDTIYINDNCTEIVWQMDVLQSYLFDFELRECLVEREHSATDEIGDNMVLENIDCSNYVIMTDTTAEMTKYLDGNDGNDTIILYSTVNGNDPSSNATLVPVNGLLSGVEVLRFPISGDGIAVLENFLDSVTKAAKEDAILGGYQIPCRMAEMCPTTVNPANRNECTPFEVEIEMPDNLDGYFPKNNKLFTYPYSFVRVASYNADSKDYRWEKCKTVDKNAHRMRFEVQAVLQPSPELTTYPISYGYSNYGRPSGLTAPDYYDYNERISITNFAPFAWTIDSFKSWLSTQPFGIIYDEVGPKMAWTYTIGYTLGHFITGAATAATNIRRQANNAASTSSDIKSTWHEAIKEMRDANETKNFGGEPVTSTMLEENDFHYRTMSLRATEAEIIDNYFTYFGYQVSLIKVPNTGSRKYWNYVKTANCMLESGNHFNDTDAATISIPADVQSDIQAIFNSGITLWHGPYFVNEYNEHDNECTGLEGFQRPAAPTT